MVRKVREDGSRWKVEGRRFRVLSISLLSLALPFFLLQPLLISGLPYQRPFAKFWQSCESIRSVCPFFHLGFPGCGRNFGRFPPLWARPVFRSLWKRSYLAKLWCFVGAFPAKRV